MVIILGPEFPCSGNGLKWQRFMKHGGGMMGLLQTAHATETPEACSLICGKTPRCHGFTNSDGEVCKLYDYYTLPENSVMVEEYYQLHCV